MKYLLLPLLLLFLAGCSSVKSLTSVAPSEEIVIDAEMSDWTGVLRPIEGETISLGVLNDSEFLYVAFVTHNPQTITKVLRQGMTYWLDPSGGKERMLGLRFPTGLEPGQRPPQGIERQSDTPTLWLEWVASNFEILYGEQVWRYPVKSLTDLDVSLSMETGSLAIEVRIPLAPSENFNYSIAENGVLGIGLETPQVELGDLTPDLTGATTRGGGGGFGRGRSGGGFGRAGTGRGGGFQGGGQGPRRPVLSTEPLKVWTKVTLSQ